MSDLRARIEALALNCGEVRHPLDGGYVTHPRFNPACALCAKELREALAADAPGPGKPCLQFCATCGGQRAAGHADASGEASADRDLEFFAKDLDRHGTPWADGCAKVMRLGADRIRALEAEKAEAVGHLESALALAIAALPQWRELQSLVAARAYLARQGAPSSSTAQEH